MKHYKTKMQYVLLAWFFITTVLVILIVAVIQALSLALSAIAGCCGKLERLIKKGIDPLVEFKDKIAPQPCDIAGL